ncbi:acetyltransferase [Vibrio cholerae]
MITVAIFGASGHGKVVAEVVELNGLANIMFFDDRWPKLTTVEHWPVCGNFKTLLSNIGNFDQVYVAIGCNEIRLNKHLKLMALGASSTPLVHPKAIVSRYVSLGYGTVVMAGAVINPFCDIGEACIINTSCSIDHDSVLSDGVHIGPGARLSGSVSVGRESWVGIGASVKQLVTIGNSVVVGAGSTVIGHVSNGQTVVGCPAKSLVVKE